MGIYNCAPYLQEALDSLYTQTFQDFEIILCDDGSKDLTYQIAYENQQKHSNVILLKNPQNLGLNQTLNNCLAVAQGEYIARMDGDDISMPTRFEREVHFLDEHPEYAIVSTPMVYFDENGIFGKGSLKEGEPSLNIFNSGSPFCHAPCMVRREAYEKVGGYTINKRLIRVEDYNLWTKMYAMGYKGYNIPEHLYAMRDDRNAYRRRSARARLNGIYAHYIALRKLHLPFTGFSKYVIITLAKIIMPMKVYDYFHKRNLNK